MAASVGRRVSPPRAGHERGASLRTKIARRDGALIDYLEPLLASAHATLDPAQAAALDRLQRLSDELAAFRAARQSTLKRLFAPPDVPRGLYLWGGVGRGKSFLMDSFFATVPIRRKTRVHFHAFMRDVHEELQTLKNEVDPLATVAARIAKRWRLICFDEFHVSDIADAMVLGPAAGRAVRRRRRVRDDVQLSARTGSIRTACSARTSCRRSGCSNNGSTWSRSTAASTTGCARWSRWRRSTSRPGARPMPRWSAPSTRCAPGPTRTPKLVDRAAAR